MGGHAFPLLHCPRIPPDIYTKVKQQTTTVLRTIFSHVVVPAEMPEKEDYGDIDFLVSSPFHSPSSTNIKDYDWIGSVLRIKSALSTRHGRQGFKNPGCMYFAIRAPDHEDKYWIQVDVKVCFKPEMFEWETFELNYASNSKMIGSMLKPLGLTIDPEGLHIRVQEIEETNFPGSMVWVSKNPRDVLRLAGLDRRIINAGFGTKDEIYEYLSSSWLFHPGHFAARLAVVQYYSRLEDRSPHWTYFIKEWVPKHYPGYNIAEDQPSPAIHIENVQAQKNRELQTWYKLTRAALNITPRELAISKKKEEQKLRAMITAAIPVGDTGWRDDFPQPRIIIKQADTAPDTPEIKSTAANELTPPLTPIEEAFDRSLHRSGLVLSSPATLQSRSAWIVPLYLEPLSRAPPLACVTHPPPANFSPEAKLLCIARWTLFDHVDGTPYLLSAPRDKDFEMNWADAAYFGATDRVLVDWAKEMWWHIWIRQSHTNYVGMWKKRFEKEDRKIEKKREDDEMEAKEAEAETKAKELAKTNRESVTMRLRAMNLSFGLVKDV